MVPKLEKTPPKYIFGCRLCDNGDVKPQIRRKGAVQRRDAVCSKTKITTSLNDIFNWILSRQCGDTNQTNLTSDIPSGMSILYPSQFKLGAFRFEKPHICDYCLNLKSASFVKKIWFFWINCADCRVLIKSKTPQIVSL